MEILVLTTFAIILAFSLINATINILSYNVKKEEIYKLSAYFWVALIINFLLQAVAQENRVLIIASFSFSLVPVHLLCLSLHSILDDKYFTKLAYTSSFLAIILASLFSYLNIGFLYSALPLSIATAIPLGFTAFKLFNTDRNQKIFKLIGIVLILFMIHGFNFTFFRMDSTTQLWGWPIAYALYQAIAALLPIATLAEFHFRESSRMQEIIDQQTQNLEASNRSLQSTVSLKNFLFRTLVHDIATPLMISKSSLDSLKLKNESLSSDTNLNRADNAITKMIQISSDLRSIESKKLNLNLCSVLECVKTCEETLGFMIEDKNLKLIYNKDLLEQIAVLVHKNSFVNSVLGNLLRNSIKFSPRHQSIHISAGFVDEENVWITVQNLGEPIEQSTIANIFDFNSETNKQGTEGEQGTGWGLPICKIFIDNYQGSLEISSRSTDIPNLASIEARLVVKGSKIV